MSRLVKPSLLSQDRAISATGPLSRRFRLRLALSAAFLGGFLAGDGALPAVSAQDIQGENGQGVAIEEDTRGSDETESPSDVKTSAPLRPASVATEVVPTEGQAPVADGGKRQPDEALSSEPAIWLNFNGTPWSDVLQWFADEARMSLHKDNWPTGSFTYVDTRRQYTVDQAIDTMNLLLLREGYALIRRGQLLLVVDLEDNLARDYLRELAEPLTPSQLDERGNSDFARVTFSLGAMTPEDAAKDLELLRSPSGSIQVLQSTRKVVATDTVGVLKSIRDVLSGDAIGGDGVLEISLVNRPAEDILEVARPHLGLEAGVNVGEDIKLSTNFLGDRIYATGDPVKLQLLKALVEKSDRPLPGSESGEEMSLEVPVLRTYSAGTSDPTVVQEVLSRLLAGLPDVRMTMDPKTSQLIIQARESEHKLITETLGKLSGQSDSLVSIPLRRLDPQAALLTINKYFGKTAENDVGPTVDGDPVTKKIWVKGTEQEIAEVRRLIEELEGSSGSSLLGERIRILPYSGRTAEDALGQLERLWEMSGRSNRIRIKSSQDLRGSGSRLPERRLNEAEAGSSGSSGEASSSGGTDVEPTLDTLDASLRAGDKNPFQWVSLSPVEGISQGNGDTASAGSDSTSGQGPLGLPKSPAKAPEAGVRTGAAVATPRDRLGGLTPVAQAQENSSLSEAAPPAIPDFKSKPGSDIIIELTPQGLIVASDDPEALNDLEELMSVLAEQVATAGEQPTVYWLKYIQADVAAQLLNGILSGASSGGGGGIGDMASSMLGEIGGGMLGGLLGLGGGGGSGDSGPVFTTTGTVSIVADARLNALIIQANSSDLTMVEEILTVIDREESPEDVQTTPKPRVIPVIYQDANEVANIVKSQYSGRLAGQENQNRQPSPQDLINALRGGGRGGRGGQQGQEIKPTPVAVSVDARTNSLIVSAVPQDFEDIRELVSIIDQGGMEMEEAVEVIPIDGKLNPTVVQNALNAILGPQARTNTNAAANNSRSSTNPGTQPSGASPSDIQQRIDFFRSLQQSRGGGFPSGGFPSGGFGGRGGTSSGASGFGRGGFPGGSSAGGRSSNRGGGR